MRDNNLFNRRDVLKTSSSAAFGIGGLSATGLASATADSSWDNFRAENYIKNKDYLYRRVLTANTDMLLKFDLDLGRVEFAKITTQSDSQNISKASTDPLEKQTHSMVTASDAASAQSQSDDIAVDPVGPSKIVAATPDHSVESNGVIFRETDVVVEKIGNCDSFLAYDDHMYFQASMRLQDYSFDDIGDTLALAAVCDALFILIGSKSKLFKKILEKISEKKIIRAFPDSICAFIFQDVLDSVFSGNDATFALRDKDGSLVNEPKIAIGGSGDFDQDPEDMRNNHKTNEYPGAHTGAITL